MQRQRKRRSHTRRENRRRNTQGGVNREKHRGRLKDTVTHTTFKITVRDTRRRERHGARTWDSGEAGAQRQPGTWRLAGRAGRGSPVETAEPGRGMEDGRECRRQEWRRRETSKQREGGLERALGEAWVGDLLRGMSRGPLE